LASGGGGGGGRADQCIRFWNTLTGQGVQCVDTGSQFSNLAWVRECSELAGFLHIKTIVFFNIIIETMGVA
jgi:hypothetical protein